jgi:hypothetical protein
MVILLKLQELIRKLANIYGVNHFASPGAQKPIFMVQLLVEASNSWTDTCKFFIAIYIKMCESRP